MTRHSKRTNSKFARLSLTLALLLTVCESALAQAKPGVTPNWGTTDIQSNPQVQPSFRKSSPEVKPGTQFNTGVAAIEAKYKLMGGPGGFMGAPKGDFKPAANGGTSRMYQHGLIIWGPSLGAFQLFGASLAKYAALGFEKGPLGYPTYDPVGDMKTELTSQFQKGVIIWNINAGAHAIYGPIYAAWLKSKQHFKDFPDCGIPLTDEADGPLVQGQRTRQQKFNNGTLTWESATNTVIVNRCGGGGK